ncbi:hypothetical protein C8R47DRAFT_1091475 [Mycena vitilis]|nr:hypothetical protein C8R47DRAFT_1091475 [Mycena vitilis]
MCFLPDRWPRCSFAFSKSLRFGRKKARVSSIRPRRAAHPPPGLVFMVYGLQFPRRVGLLLAPRRNFRSCLPVAWTENAASHSLSGLRAAQEEKKDFRRSQQPGLESIERFCEPGQGGINSFEEPAKRKQNVRGKPSKKGTCEEQKIQRMTGIALIAPEMGRA